MTSRSDGPGPQKAPNTARTPVQNRPPRTAPPPRTSQADAGETSAHRHARRAAGDRGPWVSLPLRATIPEGNTVGMTSLSDGLGPTNDPEQRPDPRPEPAPDTRNVTPVGDAL